MSTWIERIRKYDSVVEDYKNQCKECSNKQTTIRNLNKLIIKLTKETEELKRIILEVSKTNKKRSNKKQKNIN